MSAAIRGQAYDRITGALEAMGHPVRISGGRAMARCPHHPDSSPSLAISAISGQVLVYCHAGCATEDVLGDLGLTLGDLFDSPQGRTYSYPGGRVVHRSPTKQFRQSGDTSDRSLYRLDGVLAAVKAGRTVYVTEGEKDADAICDLTSQVATCSPMGAGKWSKIDDSPLTGADVVVVVDRDEPGKRHALDIMRSLGGRARSLRFTEAVEGKDAADHLAAGLSLDDLIPVQLDQPDIDLPPEPTRLRIAELPPLRLLDSNDLHLLPKPEPLLAGTLEKGTLAVIVGQSGALKSFVVLDWLACLATDEPWLGTRPVREQHRVLYVAGEGAHGIDQRLAAWREHYGSSIQRGAFQVLPEPVNLGSDVEVERLRTRIDSEGIGVVAFDTLAMCMTGLDENSSRDMGVAIAAMRHIQQRGVVAGGLVLAAHHSGRADKGRARGSNSLDGAVDTMWVAQGDRRSVELTCTKQKNGPDGDRLRLGFVPVGKTGSGVAGISHTPIAGPPSWDMLFSHFTALFSHSGCSQAQLVASCLEAELMSKNSVYRAAEALVSRGLLVDISKTSRPFYTLPPPMLGGENDTT